MWFSKRALPINIVVHLHVTAKPARDVAPRRPSEPVSPRILIPTDLLLGAFRQLFPAERMMICGGYRSPRGVVRITSVVDVTEANPSAVHVRACPQKLAQALIDFERTGAHLALWLHSHPGDGPLATYPSNIDLRQERELRQHYSAELLCAIAVRDGHVRFWADTVRRGIRVQLQGVGVDPSMEDPYVYRLKIS